MRIPVVNSGRALAAIVAALSCMVVAMPAVASRPYVVNSDAVHRLEQGVGAGQKLVLEGVPVIDGDPATLELERFEVWAPDANIVVYEKDGKATHTLARPKTLFYKGHIAGNSDSTVALSVSPNGHIEGSIYVNDRVFNVARGVARPAAGPRAPRGDDDDMADRGAPLLVREFDPVEDLVNHPEAQKWHCDVEKLPADGLGQSIAESLVSKGTRPKLSVVANGTPTVGVSYKLNLAIETDGELYAAFGSASTATDNAVTAYLSNLIAQASVIYQRDLSTTLTIGTTHIWQDASADPWTVAAGSGTSAALAQLGMVWHNNYSGVARSAVVMLSGKLFSGGVAWSGSQLCANDFSCGATGASCGSAAFANSYAGPYAFCGSSGVVSTTTPDPTAIVNGVQYGLPGGNYWPLLEVCHELGHNANGPHTHCVALSASQQTTYNVPGRTFIDLCFGIEGGCYAGSVSAPAEKGTIMSYCHNINVAGLPASRFMFFKAGEANELMLGDTDAKCGGAGTSPCRFSSALINSTSGLDASFTLGNNLSCAAGQTASASANGSATFAWQIAGGNITSATNTNSVTFTPNAPSVTLTVTVTNAKGCAIVYSQTAATQCGAISAPTNVVATATTSTSVSVAWTAVGGASSYQVFRASSLAGGYTQIGTPGTNAYTDNTASANTAYLYKVRAVGGGTSGDSNIDLATTMIFTDPVLTPQSSTMNAVHITELRTAVNAVRTLANLSAGSFPTDTVITAQSTLGKAAHITELRTALDAARSACGLSAISYTDSTLTIQSTQIKAAHITDLRTGVQ